MELMELKPPELALVINLCYFQNSDGWKDRKQLMEKNPRTLPKYDGGGGNLSNYLKELVGKGLVEARWHEYRDNRRRKHKKRQFRLKQTLEVCDKINQSFERDDMGGIITRGGGSKGYSTFMLIYDTDFWKLLDPMCSKDSEYSESAIVEHIDKHLDFLKEINNWRRIEVGFWMKEEKKLEKRIKERKNNNGGGVTTKQSGVIKESPRKNKRRQ